MCEKPPPDKIKKALLEAEVNIIGAYQNGLQSLTPSSTTH